MPLPISSSSAGASESCEVREPYEPAESAEPPNEGSNGLAERLRPLSVWWLLPVANGEKSSSSSSTSGTMLLRCSEEESLGELKTSGILIGALAGVPSGE